MILECRNVSKKFGGLVAVNNVTFQLKEKEILGLVGPNGSGKTTLINLISGFLPLNSGTITFLSQSLNGLRQDQIAKIGIRRTFQIPRPFPSMSVKENVLAGLIFANPKYYAGTKETSEWINYILDFTGLYEKREILAEKLTVPDRKRLEIARALVSKPRILLLDEAMAGLNPKETEEAIQLVMRIREKEGISMIVVEHVMRVIMNLSDRIIVLHHGEKIFDGLPKEIAKSQLVIDAYLGKRYESKATD